MRLAIPFFYGWIIVAVGFVTMAIGVNARTAFSLLFPPILEEYGWERGVTAGVFSFGFFVSAMLSPLGALVGGGGNCLGYTGQSLFLPNWFVRRRGLAASLTFSGVGVGSIVLLPWLQSLIARAGWRAACWTLGLLVLGVLVPPTSC